MDGGDREPVDRSASTLGGGTLSESLLRFSGAGAESDGGVMTPKRRLSFTSSSSSSSREEHDVEEMSNEVSASLAEILISSSATGGSDVANPHSEVAEEKRERSPAATPVLIGVTGSSVDGSLSMGERGSGVARRRMLLPPPPPLSDEDESDKEANQREWVGASAQEPRVVIQPHPPTISFSHEVPPLSPVLIGVEVESSPEGSTSSSSFGVEASGPSAAAADDDECRRHTVQPLLPPPLDENDGSHRKSSGEYTDNADDATEAEVAWCEEAPYVAPRRPPSAKSPLQVLLANPPPPAAPLCAPTAPAAAPRKEWSPSPRPPRGPAPKNETCASLLWTTAFAAATSSSSPSSSSSRSSPELHPRSPSSSPNRSWWGLMHHMAQEVCEALQPHHQLLLEVLLELAEDEAKQWTQQSRRAEGVAPHDGVASPPWEEGWISLKGCCDAINAMLQSDEALQTRVLMHIAAPTSTEIKSSRKPKKNVRITLCLCEYILRRYHPLVTVGSNEQEHPGPLSVCSGEVIRLWCPPGSARTPFAVVMVSEFVAALCAASNLSDS